MKVYTKIKVVYWSGDIIILISRYPSIWVLLRMDMRIGSPMGNGVWPSYSGMLATLVHTMSGQEATYGEYPTCPLSFLYIQEKADEVSRSFNCCLGCQPFGSSNEEEVEICG